MNLNDLFDSINNLFRDRTSAADARIDAGKLRTGLGQVLDFLGCWQTLFATKAVVCQTINGVALNRDIAIIPVGTATFRHFRMATFLPTDNVDSHDTLRILANFGGWSSAERTVIDLTMANRNLFSAYAIINGNPDGNGLVGYRQNDGTISLYLRLKNAYQCASISVLQASQVTLYENWTEGAPTGTIVYDSTNVTAFPPALLIGPTVTATTAFLRTGYTNRAFQITDAKAGANLTLKTNQYVEMKLDDGTVLKLALIN